MKKLIDYKDEINKCSKCGLCQSVCPVYQQTGNDCAVSRGKFIMLNGIIKGDLKLNKNVNKYLDMCLKCNACKDFCPSGIDARKIFLAAKAEYFQNCPSLKFIKAFQSKFIYNSVLDLIKIASSTYRFLKFDKLVKVFYPLLLKMGKLGKKVILANEFLSESICNAENQGNEFKMTQKATQIVYFEGCVNEYINPRTKNATESVLAQMNVEILPIKFECCGVPFLSAGNAEQFKKQAEFNLAQIPDEFDFFLTDCASCQSAFFEYENYIEDEKLLEKLKKINEKSLNIVDFVVKNAKSFEFEQKTTFTFHKPCHLENMDFLKEFLAKAKNIEYIEMKDFDVCCGFSGEFALKNPEISAQISAQKASNCLATKADCIVTSCPACVLGITQGIIEVNGNRQKKLRHPEFISGKMLKQVQHDVRCESQNLNIINFIELIATSKIEI